MRIHPSRCPIFALRHVAALVFSIAALTLLTPSARAGWAPSLGSIYESGDPDNSYENFGRVLARGDFNGDGFDDLASSDPSVVVDEFLRAGKVWIAFGGPDGLDTENLLLLTQSEADPGSECGAPSTADGFGEALAVGDFNDDGRDDLAVGSPGEDISPWFGLGVVAVFFGGVDGDFVFGRCFAYGLGGLPGSAVTETRFGSALASGDFDSDGLDDLVVGAPGALVNGEEEAGSVIVIAAGQAGPLDPSTAVLLHQDLAGLGGAAEEGDRFGMSLATGDLVLGLDVACDLAIGADSDHLENAGIGDRGSVTVVFGCGPNGLDLSDSVRWFAGLVPIASQAGQDFGSALAIGNFDCVGADDLAIGIPRWQSGVDEGAVAMIYGDQSDITGVVLDTFALGAFGGPHRGAQALGRALATVPSDGGCEDLTISAPGFSSAREGVVFSLEARFGIGVTPILSTTLAFDDANINDNFGRALAVGRFDGKQLSLAVGAPEWDPPGGGPNDGGVWIVPSAEIFADGFEAGTTAWSHVVGD